MKVLIACEESQRVCIAFRERGHEAYSCDIQECSGGHPEWHIQDDVLNHLDGWDLIIAHPPCTDLCVSGAASFQKKKENGNQRKAIEFFAKFLTAKCDKIAIENPIGIISGNYIKQWYPDLCSLYDLPRQPSQIIQPWMFGDNYSKSTCLWLKGLKQLLPDVTIKPELEWFEWIDGKTGKKKRQPKWYADAFKLPPDERAKTRSKTFPGIAKAMAEQWG